MTELRECDSCKIEGLELFEYPNYQLGGEPRFLCNYCQYIVKYGDPDEDIKSTMGGMFNILENRLKIIILQILAETKGELNHA